MQKQKYMNLFMAGLFIMPVIGIQREINPNIIIATPTPVVTIEPILIKPNLIKTMDRIELKNINKRGELVNVKVTAKGATSITVDNDGTSVKVNVTSNTHFRRKSWGKSSLVEISVGDGVTVIGRWANEAKTEVNAVLIRNLSIQKRSGVFFGTVKTITDTGFVMTTIQRGEETVKIDSTKLINRVGETITKADIEIGHKVRVRGLWDSVGFTITEVTEIKDFAIPVVSTPSPTP
jgi:hypothetical protein